MLQDGFNTAQEDMKARALVEARVDADRMLLATHSALAADGDVLSAAQRAEIDQLMDALRQAKGRTMWPWWKPPRRRWPRARKPLPPSA
jgi:molecular chaperone HscA